MKRLPTELSRRQLLAGAASTLALLGSACRRRPYRDSDFAPIPALSDVLLLPAEHYGPAVSDIVTRGFRELRVNLAGRRVLLKPNLVEYERGTVINTHPQIVGAVAEAARRAGAREVIVGEGPGHRRDTEYLVAATGLYDVLRSLDVPFVDLNHDDVRKTRMRSRFMGVAEMALPATLLESDVVISLPKLKTHHWAGMTCGMKNLFGVVPGAVYGWPKNVLHFHGIENSIVDLVATVRPHLVVVDAIVAMEGDGPIMGKPRAAGFIAMGRDPVAVDATCARAIGVAPERLEYLRQASTFLGNIDEHRIRHLGESPSRYRFSFELIESMQGLRAYSG
jgi:uncharacterized protein (DUF362 family)